MAKDQKPINYGPSKSWDHGYVDGLNGLPKLSSARMYAGGYNAGKEIFRITGGKAGPIARKTLGYATASQQRRVERGARYS